MSIIKKIFLRENKSTHFLGNGNFNLLRPELQKKFLNGVKYNMKIIIKGDRKTGKSALFCRLKGEPFSFNYTSTDEIQVSCILWSYAATDDVIKVEVWDVVDKGRPREFHHGPGKISRYMRRLSKNPEQTSMACLDSSFIDVYKGSSGVIMIFDVTRSSTFDYVRRQLPQVPNNLPILVVGNRCDDIDNRCVSESDVRAFLSDVAISRQSSSDRNLDQHKECAPIRFCEASMANGFGLIYIHRFLNIPFLALQRTSLVRLLAVNQNAFTAVQQELQLAEERKDVMCDYEQFLKWYELKQIARRKSEAQSTEAPDDVIDKLANTAPAMPLEDPDFQNSIKRSSSKPAVKLISDSDGSVPQLTSSVVVTDFQEEIDPADTVFARSAHRFSASSFAITSKQNSRSENGFTSNYLSSTDDDDIEEVGNEGEEEDDDADGLNEDEDDDEEHLGPALGLRFDAKSTQSLLNSRFNKSDGRLASVESKTSNITAIAFRPSLSSGSSISGSPSPKTTVKKAINLLEIPNGKKIPLNKLPITAPSDIIVGSAERDAFERFLDDM